MIKTYLKRILSIVSILVITHLVLITSQVRYDHNNMAIEGYYLEEKDSLDFVLLGASEAYSDYCPVEVYKDYGFTSYTYAIDNNPFVLYERQLDQIYSCQNPKLVMIEVATIIPDKEDMGVGEGYFDATFRKLSDSISNLSDRYDLVKEFGTKEPVESYMYTPVKYHGKPYSYKRISTNIAFHLRNMSYFKGYFSHSCSKPIEESKLLKTKGDTKTEPLPEENKQALLSFLKYCKEKKYNVVFARFPHRIGSKYRLYRYRQGNDAANIIKQQGFDFIDFEQYVDKVGIDKQEDFYNESHLRACGAKKLTKVIGKMLSEKYGLSPTKLSDATKAKWDECIKYSDCFFKYFDEIKDNEEDIVMSENTELLSELKKRM